MAFIPARPQWCYHIPLAQWAKMSDDERTQASAECKKGNKVQPRSNGGNSPDTNLSPGITKPLKDIREWYEDVDGVSGERLRNCIIFLLDVKKDNWYRTRLTPSYVHRFAKKLDDETPLGWTTDPMIKDVMNVDGESIRKIIRTPKNSDEWETLHSMIFNSRGKANPSVVQWLVGKNCPLCKGKGGYNKKLNPSLQSTKRVNFQEFHQYPCECVHHNPFKQ